MPSETLTVTGLLMGAVSVLGGVVTKLWTAQQARHKDEVTALREELERERNDRKDAEKELLRRSELFVRALQAKRGESSRASEPPSPTGTG